MIPIQDLLHRIQWDPQFGKGRFVLGYRDRMQVELVRVPFQQIELIRGDHFSFNLLEPGGSVRMVPFHRVRAVWRNDQLIWERKAG